MQKLLSKGGNCLRQQFITTARSCQTNATEELIINVNNLGIRTLTINRPDKLNSINPNLYESIPKALNDESTKSHITVLTGKGKYFSSGNDLMNFAPMVMNPTPESLKSLAEYSRDHLLNYVKSFIDFKGILVGVVNGPAFGISVTTLALFDIVYAVNTAFFKTPFSKLGQSPEGCSSYLFPKLMGSKRSNEMFFMGSTLTAAEAKQVGLVTEVFPTEIFQTEVQSRLHNLAKLPPNALLSSKELIRNTERKKLHEVNEEECKLLFKLWQADECKNAMIDFASRKK